MADAFSVSDKDAFVGITEDRETGHVTLDFEEAGERKSIEVEAEDLARALFTASPTFTRRVAEYMHRALVNSLGE